MKQAALPAHLTVFLSGRCNLGCAYCYARGCRGEAPRGKAVLEALGAYLRRAPGGAKLTFLGGEPLAEGALLRRALGLARRLRPRAPLRIFTNGTLLTPAWLDLFADAGAGLTVSLDGGRAANDRSRRFQAGGGSVFGAVLERLPPARRAGVTVNMVVTPALAGRLPAGAARLLKLGFGSLAWGPDITSPWDRASLAALRAACSSLKLVYLRGLRAGRPPYEIANIYEALAAAQGRGPGYSCGSLTLGPDGRFYPCDKLAGAGADARGRFALGPPGRLPRAGLREAFFKAAAAAGAEPGPGCCAVGLWVLGRAPAGVSAAAALSAGWLADMAAAGLRSPAFLRLHRGGG